MFFYKVHLSYKGTHYSGWQTQTHNPNTVQATLEAVVKSISKYQECKVIGASRTDTGVHASDQVVKLVLPKEILPQHLLMGLNTKLPLDIRVVHCEVADPTFNPIRHCESKEYHYYFCRNQYEKAMLAESILYLHQELDFSLMQQACELFVGQHNFLSFCVLGSRTPNPNRNVLECSLEKTSFSPMEPEIYYLKIKSKGFLKYMVRFIMGSLIDVGTGKLSLEEIKKSLTTGDKIGVRTKAAPHGLHLIKINY